jgi:hypothetical protein
MAAGELEPLALAALWASPTLGGAQCGGGLGVWVGFRVTYLIAYHADRMIRTVMRVSIQASISAVQMSANSLKYVTSMTSKFMALPLSYESVDPGHDCADLDHQLA